MEVLNPRAALLSNYEVLSLLRELDSEHIAQSKTAHRIKKEESEALVSGVTPNTQGSLFEVSENLRTLEVEAIQYLSSDYLSTTQQTPEGIIRLVKGLAPYDLTKAEKLQVVNLAPTLPVELYVIVEELEDRIGDRMDEVLSLVQTTIGPSASASTTGLNQESHHLVPEQSAYPAVEQPEWSLFTYDDDVDAIGEEEQFDDTGEGIGIEGDLEMEED